VSEGDRGYDSWTEVGDRVFTRRYRFFDQQIGAILTDAGPVVVDTRSTAGQARELQTDLRELTLVPVSAVVDTHHHYDHAFGNGVFRPAPVWGHVRCAEELVLNAETARAAAIGWHPDLADDLRATEIVAPDRTFDEAATVEVGGRTLELRHPGRGHTAGDIVVIVPDADVLFAGDLVENGAPPFFGDGYPLDWPASLRVVRDLVVGTVVPGHGDIDDVALIDRTIVEIEAIVGLVREVLAGSLSVQAACAAAPYPGAAAREPIERGLAQAGGELGPR
jgi:glyoxylase-like metal-dependent hydrolase (beta-lactamase superfamily II)